MADLAAAFGPSSIDKRSRVPIYVQLTDIIRTSIAEERLAPDQRLPSENDLSSEYNISRMTVRQAIRELVTEGYVYVRRGEGMFVGRANQTQMLVKLDGFSTEMLKEGHTVRSVVLRISSVTTGDGYARARHGLGERAGSALVMIERVRYLDDEPFALERSFLGMHNGAHLLERTFDERFSIYRYLAAERGISLSRAEHAIEPRVADAKAGKALQIRTGSPVLFVSGTTYSGTGGAVEYIEGWYRGDRYMFRVTISK